MKNLFSVLFFVFLTSYSFSQEFKVISTDSIIYIEPVKTKTFTKFWPVQEPSKINFTGFVSSEIDNNTVNYGVNFKVEQRRGILSLSPQKYNKSWKLPLTLLIPVFELSPDSPGCKNRARFNIGVGGVFYNPGNRVEPNYLAELNFMGEVVDISIGLSKEAGFYFTVGFGLVQKPVNWNFE